MVAGLHPVGSSDQVPILAAMLHRLGDDQKWIHASLLFRTTAGALKCLDLNSKGDINLRKPPSGLNDGVWAVPQFEEEDILLTVLGMCQSIAERCAKRGDDQKPNVNYGFRFLKSTKLVTDGKMITLEGENFGLTCSTFCLAVFQSVNYPLVDHDSWENDAEDNDWQQRTWEWLRDENVRYGYPPEVTDKQSSEIGCIRFRPEDVLGACCAGTAPVHFDHARPLGAEVLKDLDDALGIF